MVRRVSSLQLCDEVMTGLSERARSVLITLMWLGFGVGAWVLITSG